LYQRIINEGLEYLPIEKPHPDPSDLKGVLNYLTAIRNPQSAIRNWVVLDGYHFTPDYQKAIRENDYKLLVIDDMAHLEHYYADILVNQNINAPELNYSCDKNTAQLLGCDYVMLRREFLEYKNCKREIPEKAKKILVTLGGGDPDNVTLNVIEALKLLNDPDLEVKVVVGPANPNINSLEKEFHLSPFTFHLLPSVSNMPSLMSWADMAITAGGSTCWELAFMGVPFLSVILADNQEDISSGLDEAGVAVNFGWCRDLSSEKLRSYLVDLIDDQVARRKQSSMGRQLVDGMGTERIIENVLER